MTDAQAGKPARQRLAPAASLRRLTPAMVAAAAGIYLLWRVRSILAPFLIALFLAALLDPVVRRLQSRGVSRPRAVAGIFLLVLAAAVLGIVLLLPPVVRQVTDLATNVTSYIETVTQAADRVTRRADRWYDEHRSTLVALGMSEKPSEVMRRQAGPVSATVRDALDSVRVTLVRMLGQVLWLVIIPVASYYFLLDYPTLRQRMVRLLPVGRRLEADRMSQEVIDIFGAYLRGLTKVCLLYGTTAGVLFWILRLKYALFLGTAAGIFYAVPYVGPALTAVSVTVIALTTGKSVAFTILTIVLFLAMHVAYDYGVTPRVIGGSVGLHPLVNIFALMCGVTMFGVWGMILAVPVAASLKRLLEHFFPAVFGKPSASEEPEAVGSPS